MRPEYLRVAFKVIGFFILLLAMFSLILIVSAWGL
jgi:hypothetical protein